MNRMQQRVVFVLQCSMQDIGEIMLFFDLDIFVLLWVIMFCVKSVLNGSWEFSRLRFVSVLMKKCVYIRCRIVCSTLLMYWLMGVYELRMLWFYGVLLLLALQQCRKYQDESTNVFIVFVLCWVGLLYFGQVVLIYFLVVVSGDCFFGVQLLMFGSKIGSWFLGIGIMLCSLQQMIGIGQFQQCWWESSQLCRWQLTEWWPLFLWSSQLTIFFSALWLCRLLNFGVEFISVLLFVYGSFL